MIQTKLQGVFLLVLTIALTLSCSKDDDIVYSNTVTVDGGNLIELKGAATEDILITNQEDFTYRYEHYIEIFGGNIEYINLSEGYNGTGFLMAAFLNTQSDYLAEGTYSFESGTAPFTFSDAGYWTAFNPDAENIPDPIFIQSGTITITRSGEDSISFNLKDVNGKVIQGKYDLFIRGLYR